MKICTYAIDRDSDRHQANGKASDEPTSDEHGDRHGTTLESSAKGREKTADEHDEATAKGIREIGDDN